MKSLQILAITSAAMLCASQALCETEKRKISTHDYKPPERLEMRPPEYPHSQLTERNEGWVIVNLMVDTAGNAYEPTVVESSHEEFEGAARRSALGSTFSPAMLDGSPVDAGYTVKFVFALDQDAEQRFATRKFADNYRGLTKAIKANDRQSGERHLEHLRRRDTKTLYESAMLSMAQYLFASVWGDTAEQIYHLKRALAAEESPIYLQPDLFATAQRELVKLAIQTQDYELAIKTYSHLEPTLGPEERTRYDRIMQKIAALRTSDSAVQIAAVLDNKGAWEIALFKRQFALLDIDGLVQEVKLRCETRYMLIEFDPKLTYNVPESFGQCRLETLGKAGTSFTLIQI